MVMKAAVTINLRVPLDLFMWLEDEAQAIELSPTAAARSLLAKARQQGITLK